MSTVYNITAMSTSNETFFTVVGCMDGRCQEAVRNFGQDCFAAEFPDTITEAGLVGLLSRDSIDKTLLASLKNKIDISLNKHHSHGIIVYGHEDCAGNPVSDQQQKEDIKTSVKLIESLISKPVPVIGVFIVRKNARWIGEELL